MTMTMAPENDHQQLNVMTPSSRTVTQECDVMTHLSFVRSDKTEHIQHLGPLSIHQKQLK